MKYLVIILCLFSSCINKGGEQKNTLSENKSEITYEDSIIQYSPPQELIFEDSIIRYSDDREKKTIIYTKEVRPNHIRFKTLDVSTGRLRDKAIIADTLYSAAEYPDYYYARMDYLKQYSEKGIISAEGYIHYADSISYLNADYSWGTKFEYDSLGVLEYKIFYFPDGSSIYEEYYRNGRLKQYWKQIQIYAAGFPDESAKWDSLGYKIEETKYELMMPEGGSSYNSVFCVAITTEYHQNGKIKQTRYTKNFTESDECPCGKWKNYDINGKLISVQQYPPCYNFELECD